MRFVGRRWRTRTLPVALTVGLLVGAACADDGPPAANSAPLPVNVATTVPAVDPPIRDDDADAEVDGSDGSDGSDGVDAGPIVPVATVVVQSLDNIFRPEIIEVEVGTEVVWVNAGRTDHDVTPADPTSSWGVTAEGFQPGDEYRFVFTEPGTYDYFCSIHGTATAGQIGTVVVVEPVSA